MSSEESLEKTLIDTCVSLEDPILTLIRQRAAWEIPLHALLHFALSLRGLTVDREESYPDAGPDADSDAAKTSLDLKLQWNGTTYAVEVKVESASRPGQIRQSSFTTRDGDFGAAITEQAADDIEKVRKFKDGDEHLVLLIAYTKKAGDLMRLLAEDTPPSHLGEGTTTFDHVGKRGRGKRNGKGAKLVIGVYNADYY